jgi:hypothetical protein
MTAAFASLRRVALMLAVIGLVAGCDGFESGVPPEEAIEAETTLEFTTENIAIAEEDSVVSIGVTINNPPGNEVSAEILYADSASSTSASDFNISDDRRVEGAKAYVAETVTFPAGAADGDTRSVDLVIQDSVENEDQEDGIFVLQNLQGGASVGETNRLTIAIGAVTIFSQDFQNEELAPMTAFSVASSKDWGVSSQGTGDDFYAIANGFDGNEPANDWLITPALNFNDFEEETLTFRNAKNFDDGGLERGLQVKISTDYDGSGNPENFTWTDISDRVEEYSQGGYNFVSSGEIDLTDDAFQADAVYIAFQYRSSGTGGGSSEAWEVDDIRVAGR